MAGRAVEPCAKDELGHDRSHAPVRAFTLHTRFSWVVKRVDIYGNYIEYHSDMAQEFLNWVWEPWTLLWRRPRIPTPELPQVRLPSPPTAAAEPAAQLQPQLEQRADATVTRHAGPTPPSLDLNALLDRLDRRDGSGRDSRYLPAAHQHAPQAAGLLPTGRRDLAQQGPLPARACISPLYGHSQNLDRTLTLCVHVSCIEVIPVFFLHAVHLLMVISRSAVATAEFWNGQSSRV